jgi:hypothetical protein
MGKKAKLRHQNIIPNKQPASPPDDPNKIQLSVGNVGQVQTHLLSLINTHLVAVLNELRELNRKTNG